MKTLAIAPVIQQASAPATIALGASRAKSDLREGAIADKPPIWIPMEAKFAKPQRE